MVGGGLLRWWEAVGGRWWPAKPPKTQPVVQHAQTEWGLFWAFVRPLVGLLAAAHGSGGIGGAEKSKWCLECGRKMAGKLLESRPELGAATGAPSVIANQEVELGWVFGWLFDTIIKT